MNFADVPFFAVFSDLKHLPERKVRVFRGAEEPSPHFVPPTCAICSEGVACSLKNKTVFTTPETVGVCCRGSVLFRSYFRYKSTP